MKLIARIDELLSKPFPEDESRYTTPLAALVCGALLTYILYFFEPFGISDTGADKLNICLGFGTTTAVALLVYEFIVTYVLKLKGKREQWTFGKWILNSVCILLFLSIANFLFIRIMFFGYIDWSLYPAMLYSHVMIGVLPVILYGRYSLIKNEKKFSSIANEINEQRTERIIDNKDQEDTLFDVSISKIKYIEALQNYAQLTYIDDTGALAKKVERTTLKSILESKQRNNLIKCHRSFLVNQAAIVSASGNAQGLQLTLSDCEDIVPVSRSYVAQFRV